MVDLSAITRPVGRLVATAQNGLEVLRYGGLETGAVPSPFQIVESVPMYRLRRYFPPDTRPGAKPPGPPVLMVHPMMMSADMWDVTRDEGAVGILHSAGIDPWVIDFGEPDKVEGGMQRNLADHVVALSEAIDTVKETTGRDVHLAGYSQGGMFGYQTAAYRRSKDLASIIAFGSPVDTLAALPMNLPAGLAAGAADFMADHVFSRIDIPSWLARTGFQMLDPIKTAQSRLDFLRQLHDREALLPREQQRRFLASEGWIAWSGPAIAELLKQFIAHNRMMTGGFAIHGELVTLSDINCPVLAVVGEVDDIGQPASVRGIKRAAPQADVYEYLIRAGHFGLVVGSKAATQTWPTVAQWVKSVDGDADLPDGVTPMALQPAEHSESGVPFASRLAHGATAAGEMAFTLARTAADAVVAANKSARALAVETVRTLPRLARLGQINDHTRISLGRIMSEQARGAPTGECLLFDGRVHTYEAVDRRINNVVRGLIEVGVRQGAHVGVLMETRPSALVAIAALSRLGAVAVLMPPDADLATVVRLGAVSEIIADPSNLEAARGLSMRVLVLGGGESRDLHLPDDADVVDMEKIDPDEVDLPGWYRPNPGLARDLAFVAFSTVGGQLLARQITNFRWALSAFGTASAANLGRGDTVYCLTPLHHQSGLLVSLGGAVVGGARIALSRGLVSDRFVQEIRQYGVTVVSYTWAMLREVIDDPSFALTRQPPGAAVHRLGHADRAVETRGRHLRARARRRVLRHHRRPGRAGQRVRSQDRQQGQAAARRRRGRTRGLRRRRRPDPRGRPRLRAQGRHERGRRHAGPSARADRPDGIGQARCLLPGRHLGVHRVPVPARPGRRLLAGGQPQPGDPHRARAGVRLARQRRGRRDRRGGHVGDLPRRGRRTAGRGDRPGAASRRQRRGGRPVRGAVGSTGRSGAGHRACGARHGAQCVVSTADQPAARDGIPKPSRNAWYLDTDTNKYKRLTVAVRAEIVGAEH